MITTKREGGVVVGSVDGVVGTAFGAIVEERAMVRDTKRSTIGI